MDSQFKRKKKLKYDDFDLVFFNTNELPYEIIQSACASMWCHVGIIFKLTDDDIETIRNAYLNIQHQQQQIENNHHLEEEGGVTKIQQQSEQPIQHKRQKERSSKKHNSGASYYIFESTSDLGYCVVSGKDGNGVKLTLIEERTRHYARPLGLKKARISNQMKKRTFKTYLITTFIPFLLGKSYERSLYKLFFAWIDWLASPLTRVCYSKGMTSSRSCCYVIQGDEAIASEFCSEIVGRILKKIPGCIESTVVEETIIVEDLAQLHSSNPNYRLNSINNGTKSWITYGPVNCFVQGVHT